MTAGWSRRLLWGHGDVGTSQSGGFTALQVYHIPLNYSLLMVGFTKIVRLFLHSLAYEITQTIKTNHPDTSEPL